MLILFNVIQETKSKLDYKMKLHLAQVHYNRVVYKISCRKPQPVIIKMGTPEMKLSPSATILHRCGNHTGC